MTVEEFLAELRRTAKRGTALDADLPDAFRDAIRFLEANYNWHYMRQTKTIDVTSGQSSLALDDEAPYRLKSIQKLGVVQTSNEWYYLKQVDPGDFSTTEGSRPAGFIMSKNPTGWTLEFDTAWAEDVTLQYWGYYYTVPSGALSQEGFWLLENQPALVKAKAMTYLGASMRDPQLVAMYNEMWMAEIATMVQADGEIVQGAR